MQRPAEVRWGVESFMAVYKNYIYHKLCKRKNKNDTSDTNIN